MPAADMSLASIELGLIVQKYWKSLYAIMNIAKSNTHCSYTIEIERNGFL
jgi:hypothetical protein